MRKKDTLYTVNRFNRPLFMKPADVDRTHQNIFDGYESSLIRTDAAATDLPGFTSPKFESNGISLDLNGLYGNTAAKASVPVQQASTPIQQIAQAKSTPGRTVTADTSGLNYNVSVKPIIEENNGITDTNSFSHVTGKDTEEPQKVQVSQSTGQVLGGAAAQAGAIPFTVDGRHYKRGMFDATDPFYHAGDVTFSDGNKGHIESGAGNMFSDLGVGVFQGGASSGNGYVMLAGAALKSIGDIINNGWGIAVNDEKLGSIKDSMRDLRNYQSANSLDDISDVGAQINANDVYRGGVFSGDDAREKNEDLATDYANVYSFAKRARRNNAKNILQDQAGWFLKNYRAYGGPLYSFGSGAIGIMQNDKYLDTIDRRTDAIATKNTNGYGLGAYTGGVKTFDGGGQLKSAFLDDFSTDPIGAAIRYNRGLEQLQAQREAEATEAQKEQDYLAMQQRLSALETQNQGLEALVAAQNTPVVMPTVSVVPEVIEVPASSTPSKAVRTRRSGNRNWDYIEEQLRKSGKFNDVQIEGIKYNLQRESSIDPTAVGDGGAAFGLGQWHGSRKPKDMSLAGQTQHLIDTLSNFDGTNHWIGRGNYEGFMNARTPEEAHYWIAKGYERPAKRIMDKVKKDSDMSLSKLKAFGGELGTNGTDFTNGLLYIDEGGSHESNPMDGVPMGLDTEGIPNLVEEGETVYNDYVFSDRMMVPDFMYKELGLGGTIKKKGKGMSFADASKKLAQESEQRPNDPLSISGLEASLSKLAEIQETERMRQQAEEYMGLEGYACGGKLGKKHACGGKVGHKYGDGGSDNPYGKWIFDPVEAEKEVQRALGKDVEYPAITDADKQRIAMDGYTPEITREAVDRATEENAEQYGLEEYYNPYPTWMRYAPAVGAGVMSLTDLLGLTNKPDYGMADKLEAAAKAAGYAPHITYNPIGDYMRYVPMDIWFQQNALNAQSRATDRALKNNAIPVGTQMAGILANGYNSQLANGNLYRNALEYNDAKKQAVTDFNRRTNMFNSQMGLEAAMANARYRQQAQSLGLSGLAQAAALRDQIDARVGAAKSANLTNFLTSLGNIGRENFALNQINSDQSRQYGAYSNGTSTYKRTARGKKGSRWYNR